MAQEFYVISIKSSINPIFDKPSKKFAMQFYQFKIKHEAVETFLAKIEAIETAECWGYRAQEQTIIYSHTECRRWRRQQKKLSKKLSQLSIKWQPWPEKKWLCNLLANKQAISLILQFFKTIEVGSKDGTKERERE